MPHLNCSVCRPPTTSFSAHPIGKLETLARILRHSVAQLQHIAETADKRYRVGKREVKKDGSIRICDDALGELKSIHARLQCLILNHVVYPVYLQGSIKDPISPRGQASNARRHTRRRVLITEDIKQFFPSVRRDIVFDIWHRFFKCPPVVAAILTKLTTKDGVLPQGTKTSALLANLVFWEDEWRLVAALHERGIHYTRLIDDITCSTDSDLSAKETSRTISGLETMVRRKGLRLNRNKQTIARAGDRKITTQLLVNAKTALPTAQRSAIRSAVAKLRDTPEAARATPRYEHDYRHVSGKVGYLQQHNPHEAAQLRTILRTLQPRRT